MDTVSVDMTGLRCPAPIVQLNEAARKLAPGTTLHAIASDPAFELDVQAWCRRTGHVLVKFAQESDRYEAWIAKRA
jgi:TusA-related sulfurtransferase